MRDRSGATLTGAILTVARVDRGSGSARYRVTLATTAEHGATAIELACTLDRDRLSVFWPAQWGALAPGLLDVIAATIRQVDRDRVVLSAVVVTL